MLVDRPWTPGEVCHAEEVQRIIGQTRPVYCSRSIGQYKHSSHRVSVHVLHHHPPRRYDYGDHGGTRQCIPLGHRKSQPLSSSIFVVACGPIRHQCEC